MPNEELNLPTAADDEQIRQTMSRTLSDAELLEKGAVYVKASEAIKEAHPDALLMETTLAQKAAAEKEKEAAILKERNSPNELDQLLVESRDLLMRNPSDKQSEKKEQRIALINARQNRNTAELKRLIAEIKNESPGDSLVSGKEDPAKSEQPPDFNKIRKDLLNPSLCSLAAGQLSELVRNASDTNSQEIVSLINTFLGNNIPSWDISDVYGDLFLAIKNSSRQELNSLTEIVKAKILQEINQKYEAAKLQYPFMIGTSETSTFNTYRNISYFYSGNHLVDAQYFKLIAAITS